VSKFACAMVCTRAAKKTALPHVVRPGIDQLETAIEHRVPEHQSKGQQVTLNRRDIIMSERSKVSPFFSTLVLCVLFIAIV
jgi:hypothetical protein